MRPHGKACLRSQIKMKHGTKMIEAAERVTSPEELRRGAIIVFFLRPPAERKRGYCPYIADIAPERPEGLAEGTVLGVTEDRGVLVYVRDCPRARADDLLHTRHWIAGARVYLRIGYDPHPPHPEDLRWSEASLAYYRRQQRKRSTNDDDL